VPAIDTSAYQIDNGRVQVPAAAGFGLKLDENAFRAAVTTNGFVVAQ
jgi:L-alanine-DL-glutamate epimerase-like enolase superfamily enzyme